MSDELSMAQKLELVRTATSKGVAAGDAGGLPSRPQSSGPTSFPPATMSVDIQEGNRVEPPGFPTSGGVSDGGGRSAAGPCPFGEIIDIDDTTNFTKGIQGGVLICGDKNFNVNYRGINTGATGDWLISLKLTGIKANKDDDSEIFLPGVETSTGTPQYDEKAWTGSADYPDNIQPSSPSASATLYVPLGRLRVSGGVATFESAGCGNITVTHCAGTISFSRG